VHLARAARSSVVARLIIVGALTLALGATLAAGASPEPPCDGVERARRVMGSLARVVVCDPVDPADASESASAALDVFDRVDRVMSLYKPESDLSRLNRDGHSGPVALDAELIELLALSSGLSRETGGKFDVTIKPLMDHYGFYRDLGFTEPEGGLPGAIALVHGDDLIVDASSHTARFRRAGMSVDLGGIAKGFALDRAAEVLRQHGVRRAFLDLGRNLMFVGPGPLKDGRWRAAIADPSSPDGISACVEVAPGALSTSSVSGRVSAGVGHILDPKRGFVPGSALQATVWSESATRADAFSTALLLLDARSGRKLLKTHGDAAVIYRPARRATGPVRVVACG
jgi:thiamine biosynthesis lipoprotein